MSDLDLKAELRFSAYELPDSNPRGALPVAAFDNVHASNVVACAVTVPQSEWIKVLRSMGWAEIELFELSRLPLVQDANLSEALDRLRAAEEALHRGDYRAVLISCRAAFESAAKHHDAENTRLGFDLLFHRAFGDETVKATKMNEVVAKLSEYMHEVGRHEKAPAVYPTRSEAEFVLVSSLGLFSLLSRRLTGMEA